MAVMIKGQQVVWGTDGVDQFGGICTAASVDTQAQTDPVEDSNGAMTGLIIYDEHHSGTITVVCKAGTTEPSIGKAVSVSGLSGALYVTGVKKDWQNKGKKQLTISVTGGKNLG